MRSMIGCAFSVGIMTMIGCLPVKIGRINPYDPRNTNIIVSGNNWTQKATGSFAGRGFGSIVEFNGNMWLIGGSAPYVNDVYRSSDGITWYQATSSLWASGRYGCASAVFNGKIWVTAGYDGVNKGDVYSSSDGTNWTQETTSPGFSARNAHQMLVYNGKMWLIGGGAGGALNDVYYTSDGLTWTSATASAAFSARWAHSAVVYNDRMWIIGGWTGVAALNDMWYSTNGITWTSAGTFPGGNRYYCSSTLVGGKIWLIGGQSSSSVSFASNDVWYYNGSWNYATLNAGFSRRSGSYVSGFMNKLWVIGGQRYDNAYLTDTWCSD
ncbi:MAG: kelch repeat-containing protein [Spirochaetota bacterium]